MNQEIETHALLYSELLEDGVLSPSSWLPVSSSIVDTVLDDWVKSPKKNLLSYVPQTVLKAQDRAIKKTHQVPALMALIV